MRGYSEGDGLEDAAFGAGAGLFGNLGGQYAVAPLVRAAGNTSVGRSVADLLANAGTGAGNAVRGVRGQAPIPYEGSSVPRLSVGQRVVARNLPDDVEPIAAALTQGRSIDMPVTLADVSPRLRNLGSAAFRRSNLDTQEEIARLLTERSRGQAGRAQGQLEASFGPLDDPVQASRTLMEGARRDAAPFYDAFNAQPARTSPELEAMLQTPAGRPALAQARPIAANEGREHTSPGFDLDMRGKNR